MTMFVADAESNGYGNNRAQRCAPEALNELLVARDKDNHLVAALATLCL